MLEIPQKIIETLKKLKENGFDGFVVGGCVRDLLLRRKPKDWDITTNAKPEEILKIFPKSFYENRFFTVTVLTDSEDETLKEIEITTFRKEGKYTDKRHPDYIEFGKTLEEDLKRRDFTINAMALDVKIKNSKIENIELVDLFEGEKDLERKILRAVGTPEDRFSEDALRMMRAIRIAVELGKDWKIEEKTFEAIKKMASSIKLISKERIRDEFLKIINSQNPVKGIELLRISNLLKYFLPELQENYGVTQNKHHIYDCYWHALKSLEYAGKQNFPQEIRLAVLFHDIGKPRTKKGEGPDATFYNHQIVGAKMTDQILRRLCFPKREREKIVKLVRYHLFYYNVGEVKESSVRRLLANVGKENIDDLLKVRMADRIGSGCKKAYPYKLRHLRYLIEKVSQDPVSPKMLKIDGFEVMEKLKIGPGPKVGQILTILLSKVIENPNLNKKEILIKEVEELGKLKENEIEELAKKAKENIKKIEEKKDEMLKKKYWIT